MFAKTLSGASLFALALSTPVFAQSTGTTPDVNVNAIAAAPQVRDEHADSDGTKSYAARGTTTLSKLPATLRETPSSVTVMTRQTLTDLNLNTFNEAMNWTPGVLFVSNDESQGQFIARGGALETMSDGSANLNGNSGWQQLDTAIFDRIEVLKGPSGILIGNGTLSGVVNTVKKRAQHVPTLTARVSGGSWSNFLQEGDLGGPLNKAGTIRARGVFSHNSKDFFYDRAHEDRWTGYGVLDIDVTARDQISVSYTRQNYVGPSFSGNPAYATGAPINLPRSTNVYPDWSFTKWDTAEIHAEAEHHFGGDWLAKVNFTQRAQWFQFNDAYPSSGVTPTLTVDYVRRHALYAYMRTTLDAFVSGSIQLFGQKQQVLAGYTRGYYRSWGELVRPTANITGVSILNPNAVPDFDLPYNSGSLSTNLQSGYYGQLRLKPAKPLTLAGGVRLTDYDSGSQTIAPSPTPGAWSVGLRVRSQPTYYGGVVLDLRKWLSAYASYADIFVPQTVKYVSGEILPPRIGAQVEAGFKASLFNNQLNATIAWFDTCERNRSYADPLNTGFYLSIGRVSIKGYEAEISGRILPHWQVIGGYTHMDARYDVASGGSQGLDLSGWYPHDQFKLWNKVDFGQGTLKGLSLGGGVNYQSRTYAGTTGTNLLRTQYPYAVTSLSADYRVNRNVTVSALVDNVFDVTYYTRLGGTNTYNSFGRPRSFTLSLRLTR
ncbi:TonB-dependent siderophore receptor [Novosphingobium sp. KACC 22771]|uniref:TonB-dependent siderophore receptor n=1 Tax=Novosphingobium sp. KACC 22771 TaxID=3025670 RepID=UPI002366AC72|nr:TonB-dependent siderophore receptor [Novosphingobium sp. KACC 22771]WDF70933.1 TonB-dependent siderophore receptor [Novosphingobium sp. KACC 22771]